MYITVHYSYNRLYIAYECYLNLEFSKLLCTHAKFSLWVQRTLNKVLVTVCPIQNN